ncbi:HAD family hydrolase [Myxococcota bacterium]|nr:HAD family hydrolase [Myxococcota bacterium]MBU1380891.1 HAD family hydrolase [Myxococcota bacterium]MBU1497019.1 HAD family hydrolase [Myxococcota bacterium]
MKTLLFDLDGTIIDTRKDIIKAVCRTLDRCQRPCPSDETIMSYVGRGPGKLIGDCLPADVSEEEKQQTHKIFLEEYMSAITDETVPYEGMIEVLDYFLSKKTPMALVTNKSPSLTGRTLELLDLKKYFFYIYCASDVNPAKPDPAAIKTALDHLHAKPDSTVLIGDSEVDYKAAVAGGIKSCLVMWGFRNPTDLKALNPDYYADIPEDLIKLFGPLPE